MTDIIQINATWGIDLNALRGIFIIGKPLSKRELFTKHGVMIKDGIPYTGDSKGNVGTNTMINFMNWLKQCADYTETSNNKIVIDSVKPVSSISHTTAKPLYKPYIEALYLDFLNKEYKTSFINEPSQYITMRLDISMINDYFTQKFDVFGEMYNIYAISYYDSKLKEYFYDKYEICNQAYYGYIMRKLRNSIIQNIDNTIENTTVLGTQKNLVYTINGKPLTASQENFINKKYITPILSGITYHYDLTREINRRLKKDFEDSTQEGILSNVFQIDEFFPICKTWQIQIDRKYELISPKIDINFCRKKLNENAIQRIQIISGYDTILKYYNSKNKDFIIPQDVLKNMRNFLFQPIHLWQYITDLETMMKDIS